MYHPGSYGNLSPQARQLVGSYAAEASTGALGIANFAGTCAAILEASPTWSAITAIGAIAFSGITMHIHFGRQQLFEELQP